MSLIAQIWWVVGTLAWVVLAALIVRALVRLHASLDQADLAQEQLSAQLAGMPELQQQAHDTCLEVFYRVQAVHAWTVQVETISVRSVSLATLLIDELETPILRLLRIVRGVRAGLGHLFDSWAQPVDTPAEVDREPLDRWLDDGGMPPGHVARVGRTRPQSNAPVPAPPGTGNALGVVSSHC